MVFFSNTADSKRRIAAAGASVSAKGLLVLGVVLVGVLLRTAGAALA